MRLYRNAGLVAGFLLSNLVATAFSADQEGYYRMPTLHGETLVFSSEGDLWKVSSAGGDAQRLTTHAERELNPVISPDGSLIAYTASYDSGETEVYVIQIGGGIPKQVSFDGSGVITQGWTPNGEVIYTSMNGSTPEGRRVFTVNPETLATNELPLADANQATFASNGNEVFFTRYGLANVGDNAKLYRGGGMSQLWYFDLEKTDESVRLASDFEAPILHPMWWDGRVYFITDQDGTDNIWSMAEDGNDLRQHTDYDGWDIRTPHMNGGKISYQMGVDVHIYDIASGEYAAIDIKLVGDMDARRTRWLDKPLNHLTSAVLSAKGNRVALTARGHVALASPGPLRRVELDVPKHARARNAVLGANEEWVYVIIDQDRRGEIWRYPANGVGEPTRLTNDATAHRWDLFPSPDGKYLFHDDKADRLWMIDLETGENHLIDDQDRTLGSSFTGLTWSPDGRYVAYNRSNIEGLAQIVLMEIESRRKVVISGNKYVAHSPAFSADGNWLYYLAQTNFRGRPSHPWGDRNMGASLLEREKIYALALNNAATFPFAPDHELMKNDDEEEQAENEEESPEEQLVTIDWNGLTDRLYEVPVPAGDYNDLKATEEHLYLIKNEFGGNSDLKSLKISNDNPELSTFAGRVRSYALSGDGKKLFFSTGNRANGNMYIVPAGEKAPEDLNDAKLRTDDWSLRINPADEWPQMFLDAWRMHRDYAFDPNLRGLDWDQVRTKYEPLVARIGHRDELNDLIAQMVSELGILHSQVRLGEQPDDEEKASGATLGATYSTVDGGLAIDHIYKSEPGLPNYQTPLAKPNVDVMTGDIIEAVNGIRVTSIEDLDNALFGQAEEQVLLDIRRGEGRHQTIVTAMDKGDERLMRYRNWVEGRREFVASAASDNIGYLHLRAMGGNDVSSFARDFYEHVNKDGLIIDVRGNNGGNIDSILLGELLRQVWAFWYFADNSEEFGNMQQTFRGHLAVVIDERTYSDGETFAAGIKAMDLGTLIGTRTAGAGIWLSSGNVLVDGGIARVAESPQFGLDGRWLIEGWGIAPDIEVENKPYSTYNGSDAQLSAAIDFLQNKISEEPIPELKGNPIPPVGVPGKDVQD